MTNLSNSNSSMNSYEIPQSLMASLDIEELERRLELSEVDMVEAEAEAAAQGWEVGADCKTNPQGCEGHAKKTW